MKSFKEYIAEETVSTGDEDLTEVLSMQSRLKKKQSLRRNKAKIKLGKLRASRRIASTDVIKLRARRAARTFMLKRLIKGKSKSDLPYSTRQTYEKIINKRKSAIDKIARRLIPRIRRAEMQRKLGRKPDANQTAKVATGNIATGKS